MRFSFRLSVLAFLFCWVSFTAVRAATEFTLLLPAECKPEGMTVLCGIYGHGLALAPIVTKKDVFAYTVRMPDFYQKVKLLIHRSGYQIVAVEIGKDDVSKPFTPVFVPLRSNILHVRLLESGGKAIAGEQLTIMGGDWETMHYFGYSYGISYGINEAEITRTNANGEAWFTLPAWIEDPYYKRYLEKVPLLYFTNRKNTGQDTDWEYSPVEMDARHEYTNPLVITKRYRATLTVRFDPSYLLQQGLQGLFGNKLPIVDHAEVVIQDHTSRNTLIMQYAGGVFTKKLQPGTYSLGIEVFNEVDKRRPHTRYIPINIKDVVLKEKEQREILVKE